MADNDKKGVKFIDSSIVLGAVVGAAGGGTPLALGIGAGLGLLGGLAASIDICESKIVGLVLCVLCGGVGLGGAALGNWIANEIVDNVADRVTEKSHIENSTATMSTIEYVNSKISQDGFVATI